MLQRWNFASAMVEVRRQTLKHTTVRVPDTLTGS
jgi:hypothetical protein